MLAKLHVDDAQKRPAIGRQIATLVGLAVTVAVLAVSGLLSTYQLLDSVRLKRESVEGTAYVFAAAVADHVEKRDVQAAQSVLRAIARVPGVISGAVHDSNGSLMTALGQQAVLESDVVSGEASLFSMLSRGTMPIAVDIIKSGTTAGTLVLVADIRDLRAAFFRTMGAVLLASLFAAAIGVLSSTPLQRRIAKPIQTFTAFMEKVRDSRNYKSSLAPVGSRETGLLIEGFNGLIADIDQRDQALRTLAYHDPLTGLPNLASLRDELAMRLAVAYVGEGQSIAAVQFAIDGFPSLRDAFGHRTSDAMLARIAEILRREITPHDFLARIGDNGFAVLIHGVKNAEPALARIHAALYQPVAIDGSELHLSLAAGVTLLPSDTGDAGETLRFMGLAVNEAMHAGTGRTCYFAKSMIDSVRREAGLAQALRGAIAGNELAVHYQPQMVVTTREIAGYEALVRWRHPVHGNVSPAVFIPIAERNGMIAAIGEWVLEETCRQACRWMTEGRIPRTVSVNVSPAQMLQSGFARKVKDVLLETGLPPELLCLEITESMFLGRSLAPVRAIFAELREIGVTLALDDFGTGYSSLSYLSELPFDKLKIDRSFVSSIQDSPRRTALLRAIIDMAHGLKLEVVAEGAETAAELALLMELKADQVQGYVVSKPLPAAEISDDGLAFVKATA